MTVPCCGCSLQVGTKIIAVLEIIGSIIQFGFDINFMVLFSIEINQAQKQFPNHDFKTWPYWLFLSCSLILSVVTFAMGFVLFIGSNMRHLNKVKIWFRVRLIILVVQAILIVIGFTGWILQFDGLAGEISGFVISIYCLVVVYFFQSELLKEQEQGSFHTTT